MVLMSPTNHRNQTTKNHAMSAARRAHLQRILTQFHASARAKYENGQREHGGNLWQKPGMLDQAIAEATDLVIYLLTLKEQECSAVPSATKKTNQGASRSSRKMTAAGSSVRSAGKSRRDA